MELFGIMLCDVDIVSEKVFAAGAGIGGWLRSIGVIFGAHCVGAAP